MDFEKLAREAEKKRQADQRRRAKAIHTAGTEHVTARINELHHVVGLDIAIEFVEAGHHGDLEQEVRDAINRARDETDKHTMTDPVRRAAELILNSG